MHVWKRFQNQNYSGWKSYRFLGVLIQPSTVTNHLLFINGGKIHNELLYYHLLNNGSVSKISVSYLNKFNPCFRTTISFRLKMMLNEGVRAEEIPHFSFRLHLPLLYHWSYCFQTAYENRGVRCLGLVTETNMTQKGLVYVHLNSEIRSREIRNSLRWVLTWPITHLLLRLRTQNLNFPGVQYTTWVLGNKAKLSLYWTN
jgi:hypothetical protein